MDLHQKEQLHDNAMSMMHSQNFSMGRSGGFNLGATYSSHRPQQQPQHTSSVSGSLSYPYMYTSRNFLQFAYLILLWYCIMWLGHTCSNYRILSFNSYLIPDWWATGSWP
jgi:hypothetical protein